MDNSEKIRKRNMNLRSEISHLHGKITQLQSRIKAKDEEIDELRQKEKDHLDKIAELTNLVPPEVLQVKQAEWRQKAGEFTLRT